MGSNLINKIEEVDNKVRILILGGNGFIGRHVVKRALKLGWHVTIIGLSIRANKPRNLKNLIYKTADVTSLCQLREALGSAKFEYVVNCGGYVDHTLFSKKGRKIVETHFTGTLNLALLLDRNVLKSFINIGSSDEYGDTNAPQVETQREEPISPYSLGKVASTHFLQMLYRTESFPATTLRLFLAYGPGQGPERFIPQIIYGCLKGSVFPVSKGEQIRDFCFIEDVVSAIFLVFSTEGVNGEVINIASGEPTSIKEVILTIQNLIGGGHPNFGKVPYREKENMQLFANIKKAEKILNWRPTLSLNEGLSRTIKCLKI